MKDKVVAVSLFVALGASGAIAVGAAHSDPSSTPPFTASMPTMPGASTVTVESTYEGKPASWWARRARQNRRNADARGLTIHRLKRALTSSPTVQEAIGLAAVVYGHGAELRRKGWCESKNNRQNYNRASKASGLFQFLPSTWATTPFARFSVWSIYANALAAGWMHANGRGGEWQCR